MTKIAGATTDVSQWGLFELSLNGPSDGNPFKDVDLRASFAQAGRMVDVTGFYDGDGIFRLRFMPETAGIWTFVTRSNVEGLDAIAGEVEVAPARPGDHGPVRVADTFHFAYADGTPLKPIGTTSYAWTHQGEAMERQTLASLAQSPFNKIRMCVFPKHYRYNENEPEFYPFPVLTRGGSEWTMGSWGKPSGWRFDFDRFDPAFFRHLEARLADLQRLGVEADLIVFHPYDRWGFSAMSREEDDFYLRYLVARLAAFPNIWWSLANEYDLMPGKTLEDWERFFAIIAECDPYGHLRSIHNCFGFYDHTRPLITHCSVQRPDPARAALWREQYGKPVVVDESCYEGDIGEAWGNIDGHEMVHRFWDGMVNGSYVTHGETYRHAGDVIWWAKGGSLQGEAISRLHFLRRIIERTFLRGLDPITESNPHRIMLMGGMDKVTLEELFTAPAGDQPPVLSWFAGGCAPHQAYLTYFGVSQPSEMQVAVPAGETYDAVLLDTWEMAETTLRRVVRGEVLTFDAKPHQALLLTRSPPLETRE